MCVCARTRVCVCACIVFLGGWCVHVLGCGWLTCTFAAMPMHFKGTAIVITEVMDGSVAAAAGVEVNDTIKQISMETSVC